MNVIDPRDGQPCAACGTIRADGHCPGCRQAARDALDVIAKPTASEASVDDPCARLREGVADVIRNGVPADVATKLYALLDAHYVGEPS